MIATDMTSSCGTSDEKLRWAFKMYDEDGSGKSYLSPFSNKQNKNSSKFIKSLFQMKRSSSMLSTSII